MSSPSLSTGDSSFLNHPFVKTITDCISYIQKQKIFSKERLNLFKHHVFITIGFLVLLYCLIRIQILFFSLIKFIFYSIFQLISIIFWLPLKFSRLFIPKTIDYDILFPLFWLCSISSFYLSKTYHENIWLWFNQYLVRRYSIFHYQQTKREDIKRWLFILTFTCFLLLQSIFILIPITLTIQQQRQSIKPIPAVTTTNVKDTVEIMKENIYHRFIRAFQDENEKDSLLINDDTFEDKMKILQETIKKKSDQIKSNEEMKKKSRFQRWIIDSLFSIDVKETNEDISSENEKEEEKTKKNLYSFSDTHEEQNMINEKIKKGLETMKNLGENFQNNLNNEENDDSDDESGYESDDEGEQESLELSNKIQQTLIHPIKTIKNVASDIKKKITSLKHEQSNTEEIKEDLAKSFQTLKDFGEKTINNVKSEFSSRNHIDEEELKIESDDDDQQSIFNRLKETILKPFETTTTKIRDQLSESHQDNDDDDHKSFIERTKETTEKLLIKPIKKKTDQLIHDVKNLDDSIEEKTSNILERSSKIIHEKIDQIKESLPNTDQIKSKFKHRISKSLENKTTELKSNDVKKMKSLKTKKKSKDKTQLHSKKKKSSKKIQYSKRLNGLFDDGWNIWHLAKTKLTHIFIPSTKHARLFPRYNTTSLYTAYTDIHCYDYTKKFNRYRLLKRKYTHFLDSYRHHSPFPVYLSILKSNGPRCYRQYPNSSCGIFSKPFQRNFKVQLYRFVRFWSIIGVLIILLSVIYQNLVNRQQRNTSSFHSSDDSDRYSPRKQQTTLSYRTDSSKSSQRPSSIDQQTINTNLQPLDKQIESKFRQWLEREQNDGYQHLSETCRIALNNTFLKQLERLSVETLQFAHAKLSNVSQNNNNISNTTPAEKIIINARLDIDHLILNIVNTFQEKHFSVEISKFFGQICVLLNINSNQYSIEVHLQQIEIKPIHIIDPNDALSFDEKKTMTRLLEETIKRTTVRCSFRLSDNQENTNLTTIPNNSSIGSHIDTTKNYSSSNQLSSSPIQTNTIAQRQPTPTRCQPLESPPTLLVNNVDTHLYTQNLHHDIEPKKLLIRVVKAVKLHDVEQPYCILEINNPKQVQQTSIAHNGVNPFWDERFLFECNEKSNQIHLQIIDRKTTNKRSGNNYTDTLYADVTIPFSYVTSTVYKQDVQINPQHPESIIRIEFSTLSEEEALAANNGYDIESLTDSQTWTYSDRETNKLEQDYSQQYQQTPSNDYLSSSYDNGSLPKHYGLSTSLYTDEHNFASTLPRSMGYPTSTSPFSPSTPLSPIDGGNGKPHKSRSFMNSLKHLTLPGRKRNSKDKRDNSMSSQTSSNSQLNTNLQSPQTNPVSHSVSSALPGPYSNEYILGNSIESRPIRRSRSISQSFKNLFRSSSKKKNTPARTDALTEYGNVDHRNYLSTSTPTSKKLSFLHRRKSKQKTKQETNLSINSLSSYDYARAESVRDTPIRANVGHPVTMTKSTVR